MSERIEWRDFLASKTVKDLIPSDFQLVSAKENETILDVLKLLTKKNLLSVPIWNEKDKKFDRLVDMLDIIVLIVMLDATKEIVDTLATTEVDWKEYIEQEDHIISKEPVGELAGTSERNPWIAVSHVLPVLSLMDIFSKDVNIHRVVVTDNEENVIGILSQSKMIQFLFENVNKYPTFAETQVKKCFGASRVITITPNKKAFEAYQLMLNEKVSGLAVVNESGELVGAISVSDIKRSLDANIFSDLHLPIELYLEKCSPDFKAVASSQNPISVGPNDTLKEALSRLVQFKVHRLFVVEDKKPIGVLSLCDIISVVAQRD